MARRRLAPLPLNFAAEDKGAAVALRPPNQHVAIYRQASKEDRIAVLRQGRKDASTGGAAVHMGGAPCMRPPRPLLGRTSPLQPMLQARPGPAGALSGCSPRYVSM